MVDEISKPNVWTIFMELGTEVRWLMFMKLREGNLNLSAISKELNVTIQHAHNNMKRLIDIGLVEKYSDGSLALTNYGKAIAKQLSSFHFLTEHKSYFIDHTLGNLPSKFERRIGDLDNSYVIRGVVAVLQQWKRMYNAATGYINSIIPQVPVDLIEPLAEKIKSGIQFSYILPEDAVIPNGTLEATEKVSWRSLLMEGKAVRRMVKKVLVATIVTDGAAGVLFPNEKDEVDMNMMFYSEDPVFLEWCQDYFQYVWDSSELFDKTRLHITKNFE